MNYNLLRFLLLSLMAVLSGNVLADEVTMAYSGVTTTNMTGGNDAATLGLDAAAWSVVGEKGNNNNLPGLNKAGDIRLYWSADGGNTITVESLGGATVNSIALTFTGPDYSNVSVTVGDSPVEPGADGTYAIGAPKFVLGNANTSNVQVRITQVVITYTAGADSRTPTSITLGDHQSTGVIGDELALPMATVTAGETALSGALLSWSSQNEDVAAVSGDKVLLKQAGQTTLTATFEGNSSYMPSTARYTVTVCEPYGSIADMLADISTDRVYVQYAFQDLLVVYVAGSYNYVFDGQDYFLLYGQNLGLTAGDKVSGTVSGQLYLYNNLPELSTSADGVSVTVTSQGNSVAPVAITPAELGSHLNRYVSISQATFVSASGKNLTFRVGDAEFTVYNQFNLAADLLEALEAGKEYDLLGFEGCYRDTRQLFPVQMAPHQETAWTWRDMAVQLTRADIFDTSVNHFGVRVAQDGTYTATSPDDATANLVVSAVRFNDAQHGWVNCTFTVRVEGPVLVKLGDCRYGGQQGTITDSEGNVTDIKANAEKDCWDPNAPDEKVVQAYYRGLQPTTLTIFYEGYCPFIGIKAVDPADLPQEVSKYTVTFAPGEAQGAAVPAAVTDEVGTTIKLPANFTMYVEGKTFTAWSDGTRSYAPGTDYAIPEGDVTLTALFAANEVSLADRTEPVSLRWNFRRDAGAPSVQWQNQDNLVWVAQATVKGQTIDVALPFSTNPGKFNNTAWNDWCQLNQGTTFHVPSCKGAVVSMEAYSEITTTTIDGQTDYTHAQTISYEVAGTADHIDVVIGDGSYYRYLQVVLPVVQSQGGQTFDNAAAEVAWAFNDPATLSAYTATPEGAFSTVAVNTGDLEITGTATRTADDAAQGVTFIKLKPSGQTTAVDWVLKPAAGLTFTPTRVSLWIQRFGTDAENGVTVTARAGQGETVTLGNYTAPRANQDTSKDKYAGNANYTNHVVIDLTAEQQALLASGEELTLTATVGVNSSKEGGFSDVRIAGIVNGTKADVEMYTLDVQALPAEGGTINVYPVSQQYEAGTEVQLTATENFGYDFVSWTDEDGQVLSAEPRFKYTVNSNATVTARFRQVNTYQLALTVDGTNDYMVTVSPAPTVQDGKWMYEQGQVVQLKARQYDGLVTFTNWSGGDTNSEKLVAMDDNVQLTAFFAQADIIAGWDFYTAGSNGRKADFAAQDNDGDALNLVNTETGETSGWLDKSALGGGGYESFEGAAVNWRTGSRNGDVGNWHWQTKVNAEAFTDINVQFQMLYNYNAYQTYLAEYSLDGTEWTGFGSVTMNGNRVVAAFSQQLPQQANNRKDLYIRMRADKTSNVDGSASANDGNTLAMFFITGTPKLVDDGKAPVLVATVPADGATGASASGKIVLTFDERVKLVEGTVATLGDQTLTPAVSGKTVTFEYKGLEYSTPYTFTLPANSVADLTGNLLSTPVTLGFTTMVRPAVQKGMYDAVVENVDQLLAAISAAESRQNKNVRYRIFVKNGTYTIPLSQTMKTVNGYDVPECITFVNSGNISFIGESRDGVVITNGIPADATFAGTYGTTSKYDGIGNSDVFQLRGQGYYWQDLTVSTGMEDARGRDIAIQDRGTKNVYKNVCLHGYQDTWTSNNDNGLYYFEGGVIRGRTDYMCGKGDIFWNGVELRQVAGGYAAVPSKPARIGWVYKDCVINGDGSGVSGNYTLGRPWGSGTPVALFIDTRMNVVPSAIGWNEMSNGWPARFAEFNSMTASGSQIDLSGRKRVFGEGHENNPVLTAEEAMKYGDLHAMYGDWDPTLLTEQAPIPANVTLTGNTLSWVASDYALLWAVVKNGSVVAFTTEPAWQVDDVNAVYTVRAANEMGGLSEPSAPAVVADGIEEVSTGEHTTGEAVYNLNGMRVSHAAQGIYIQNGRKVVVK